MYCTQCGEKKENGVCTSCDNYPILTSVGCAVTIVFVVNSIYFFVKGDWKLGLIFLVLLILSWVIPSIILNKIEEKNRKT